VVGVNGWGFNITSDASATPNAWHHVALSATGSTVDLYIDGALKGSSERKPISTTSNPFRIGFTTNFDGTAYSGLIDEVHIISRALTAEEIADIYNAVSAGMCRSSSPLPAGLAAWWKAENNANDQLGVNNGTLNGATFSSGKVGQAFSLDGEDDFISIPDGIVASTARNFTVGAWVYANTVNASGENHIVYSGRSGGGEYYLANRNGNFEFAVYLSGSGWLRIGVTADIGVWRYVTGVRRGTAIEIWVDGMLRNSMTIPDSDLVTGAAVHSSIGSYNRGQYGFWDGLIDEASIFNRALSADEIASIYNAGGSGMFTPDTTPDAFSFTSQAGVPRNTSIVSNPITVTGINSPADISIVDGEYSISTDNGVNWTPFSSSTPSTVGLNNQVKVRRTSAATNNSTVTAALTIGGVSEDFYVTTLISTPVSDDITGNTIWRAANSPYYVTGLIVVNSGVTLTIEPGTVVKFGQGINITGINVSGNLVANGASGTIFFTDSRDGTTPDGMTIGGSTPLAGSWYGIQVLAGGSATMDHCEVRYGGNSGSYQANVGKHGGGSLSLTNSIIRNSACYGVRIFDASGGHTVSGNIISNSGNSGIYLSNIGSGATISGNTISNNPSYGIDLDNGSPVISGNTISASAYGIRSHNASPSITSNSSTGNSKYGLYLTGVANPSAITGNTLTGNTTGGVGMTAEASGAVVADSNIFSGPLHIEVGSIVSAVSWSSNRVYYVVGLIAVNAGVTLTIEPGTVVKFAQGIDTTGINVTGNLVANGASGTIFFTDSRDGTTPDGMTIGSSTPSAGSWYGIQVLDGGSATIDHCEVRFGGNDGGYQANVAKHGGGSLRLTNSIIRNSAYYGVRIFASGGGHTVSGNTIGNSGNSGIYLENSGNGVTISGNSISGNTSKGLHLSGAGTTPLVKNNRIFSNSIGILCDASASPVIGGSAENGNDIYNNTFGVQNASANTVTATDNWWGSATGPIHSTNPNGTGNAVSENVNFIPFQTTSFHTFDLTIAFAGSGNGTVNVTPGGGSGNSGWTTPIHVGDSITLTADPAPDAVFGGWSGGGCSGTGTCSFTMDGDVTITATFNGMAPVADFTGTPLSGVEPLIVSFTDTTTFAPYSWLWNFGDSSGSFAKNPVHAYLDPGTFNVSLAATNAYGSDTETKTGFVTVTACPHGPASILPDFYDSLQEAYGNSANGSMIRARYKVLGETLNINRENTTVYIYGGYDCDHQNQLGVTTIGTLTVSKGTTFVRDIVIK
jgi:parallel beta-helix repeat protein